MNGNDEKRKFYVKEEFVEWAAEAFAKAMKQATETIEWLERREIDLSTARDADPISMIPPMGFETGNYIKVISCDGEASLRLDTQGDEEFDVSEQTELRLLFHDVYVTNTAQSGKKLLVLSLGRGDFGFPESPEKRERRTVLVQIDQTLAIHAIYTSSAFDVLNHGRVTLLGWSVAGSIANGVRIQQSIDGTNWDYSTNYTAIANAGLAASVELVARYVRVSWQHPVASGGNVRLALIARSMA